MTTLGVEVSPRTSPREVQAHPVTTAIPGLPADSRTRGF